MNDNFRCFNHQNTDDWAGRFDLPYGLSRKKAIDLLSKRYRQIDVELWVAYENQEYGRMKTLLSFGANPFVEIDDNDCVYDRIGWYVTDKTQIVLSCMYDDEFKDVNLDNMVMWLFQWCVGEQLIYLLDSYCSYDKKINLTPTLDRLKIEVGGYCPEDVLF